MVNVFINYNGTVLIADSVTVNETTKDAFADGNVRIQQGDQIWIGEHIRYNLDTHQMVSEQFRTGHAPVYMEGQGLHGSIGFQPPRAKCLQCNQRHHHDGRRQTPRVQRFAPAASKSFQTRKCRPGTASSMSRACRSFIFLTTPAILDRTRIILISCRAIAVFTGPFILSGYTWYLNDELNGIFHMDYRERRGAGVGPDFNYNLGRWGEGSLKYYYTYDQEPQTNNVNAPVYHNRQRVYFSYLASPYTNVEVRSQARYQSDAGVNRDFFEGDYRENPQPSTFVEGDKLWQNFSILTRSRSRA